jgi:hypothetical protein
MEAGPSLQCEISARLTAGLGHQRPNRPTPPIRPRPQHPNSNRKFKGLGSVPAS